MRAAMTRWAVDGFVLNAIVDPFLSSQCITTTPDNRASPTEPLNRSHGGQKMRAPRPGSQKSFRVLCRQDRSP
jgi:hypothetical protein